MERFTTGLFVAVFTRDRDSPGLRLELLTSGLFKAKWLSLVFELIVETAMAISFEVRVGHLVTEFLADALVLFRALQTAWTVAAFGLETFADHRHDFLVFVKTDSHYFSTPK